METKALRQKILDLAIRGKLLPQETTDEPASVLLSRIREEKKEKVKTGELKPSDLKKDSVIFVGEDGLHYEKFADGRVKSIEEEIPFALPKGWAWERLGNVSTIARGGSPRPIEDFITDAEDGINWIKIGDTEKGGKYIWQTKEKIKPSGLSKSRYVKSGDFLLTNSMSFGRPYILKTDGCIHDGWLVIGDIKTVFNQDYLYYALSSSIMFNMLSFLAAGSTVKNLKSDTVRSVLFPIPPLAEQKRIADRVATLFECLDEWDKAAEKLRDTAEALKAKALAEAVRGALCPQEETDEPASALLSRIRAEKKKRIQEGKLKKEKNPTEIIRGKGGRFYETANGKETDITDDLPFAIPDTWEWVRLGDIFSIEMGQSPAGNSVTENPDGMEFHQGKVSFGKQYLKESGKFTSAPKKIAPADSVLLCVRAPVGKVNITEREICIGRGLCAISPFADMPLLFVYYSLLAYESIFVKQATGTTFVAITAEVVKNQLFPLPPLAEQKRIAARLTRILSAIEELKGQN